MQTSALNPANLLTLLRFCLVPVVIVAIVNKQWTLAFVLFVTAGITDAVDGFIARHFDMRTELGAYLDPLADKALLVSIYITLAAGNILPTWLAVLVVSRDIMIVGAVIVSWIMDNPVEINPLKLSKANTAAQISFAALMLSVLAFNLDIPAIVSGGITVVMILTLASLIAYFATWFRHMAD
ncbi:MAG: CDP-alcohol phosphatidyltransferase family protein [Beijerinckiaceae bacterium]